MQLVWIFNCSYEPREFCFRGSLMSCCLFIYEVSEGEFCPQNGYLLWMPKENAVACPQNGLPAWTQGARRLLLSTEWVSFVDAEGKCSRLSTQGVPGVDARCLEETFVHRMGIFCGCRRKMQPPVPSIPPGR